MLKFFKKLKLFNKKNVSQFPCKDQDDFSIDVFQLENLINNKLSFLFFNLSSTFSVDGYGNFVSSILKSSQASTQTDIRNKLEKVDKSKPIILICERGNQSRDLARHLHKEGFINVFFVTGGIMSLTKEDR